MEYGIIVQDQSYGEVKKSISTTRRTTQSAKMRIRLRLEAIATLGREGSS